MKSPSSTTCHGVTRIRLPAAPTAARHSVERRRRGRGWRPTPHRARPSGRGCASAGRGARRDRPGRRARSRRRSRRGARSPLTGVDRARAAASAAKTTWAAGWPTACLLPSSSSRHAAATTGTTRCRRTDPAVGAEQRVRPGRGSAAATSAVQLRGAHPGERDADQVEQRQVEPLARRGRAGRPTTSRCSRDAELGDGRAEAVPLAGTHRWRVMVVSGTPIPAQRQGR